MPMVKGIAVAGATGEVGKRLVENLILHNPKTQIHLLVRRISPDWPSNVKQHIVDFNHLDELTIKGSISIAYNCLGTTIKLAGSEQAFKKVDHDFVINFAKWAQKHGCNRFATVSSVGANIQSKNFYLRVKGETEVSLKNMGWQQLWVLRPSLLLGDREAFRLGEFFGAIIGRLFRPFLWGALAKYKPIQMMRLAQNMSKLATLEPQEPSIRILEGKTLFKG